MKFQPTRLIPIGGLLMVAPAAWAHPSLFEGGLLQSLVHQLTQPDHLLLLACIGLVVSIVLHISRRA